MGARHKFVNPKADGTDATVVRPSAWNDDHEIIPVIYTMVSLTTAAAPTGASAAIGVEAFATPKTCRLVCDLRQATEMKLSAMVVVTGSAAGGALKLSYMTTSAATWAGTDAGVSVVLGANGGAAGVLHESAWTAVPAAMDIASIYLTALVGVAMGTTAPTISSLFVSFR